MKESPILFRGPMVRAILSGRKTQTRRPVSKGWLPLVEEVLRGNKKWDISTIEYGLTIPFGEIGDCLWLRETWHPCARIGREVEVEYLADQTSRLISLGNADLDKFDDDWISSSWKPSIHMPRWASRITLEIINVRVEKIQEISEEDAKKEGMIQSEHGWYWGGDTGPEEDRCLSSARMAFANLWNKTTTKEKISWYSNPWVWVIDFKVVKK